MKQGRHMDYTDVGCAKLDGSRWERLGVPEAVYCPGKTLEQIRTIIKGMLRSCGPVLLTHADKKIYLTAKKIRSGVLYYSEARMVVINPCKPVSSSGYVAVVTGGTADIPVAEEARVTAEALGKKVVKLYDVGVAGVHRLLLNKKIIDSASCVIVCAGMEGALASVVGGMVGVPVIAVPTSIGYGASFKGISPLLTMLNSCSPNVTVVNIDNGFGAGIVASLIMKKS
ncbi:MAG: nickel pincer cofactor biosynthesis protein LarB [bacterium]